ncbi:MAG: family 78 glycoside hydrolase catalytic domain [Bacteroidaceae bacterium]|nr:family 78 glycoside hydrolase catalytic domain [Bacteroidaceae bacterium]
MPKLFFCLLSTLLFLESASARLKAVFLTCEDLNNPMAVGSSQPRLSWVNVADRNDKNQLQTAYHIQVASTRERLLRGDVDLWDSGRRRSDESRYIPYKGNPLSGNLDCYWRVKVWDKHNKASKWSEVARFHTALQPSDWVAEWIGSDEVAPLFRKDFEIDKQVQNAHIFICGLGYFELYVDGKKVSDDVLVPGQTDYSHRNGIENTRVAIDNEFTGYRQLYLGYDLTPFLSKGRHALGVWLGNGFFNSQNGFAMPYGKPRLIAQLILTFADGSSQIIPTDTSWMVKQSGITQNGIFSGECFDARLHDDAWCNPSNSLGQGWGRALPREAPDGLLQPQMSPPDKVCETFAPKKIERLDDKSWRVDFGEEISGWVHLKDIQGQAGQQIEVKYLSESPNGENIYIMKGGEGENYHPRFTWFVFRQVEIKGLEALQASQIQAEAVNTELPQTGFFACSDTLLTKIHRIWRRTLLDNAHGSIISDCPHRERSAYLGDGQVAAEMVMRTFDARAFYRKWFADMRLAQNPRTGFVPFGAPWQPGCGGGVPWSAAMILMPYDFYQCYGDSSVLRENFPSMLRLMDYFSKWVSDDGTMEQHYQPHNDMTYWCNLGEWCTPTETFPPNALVHTYFYWLCAKRMASIAKILGENASEQYFSALEERTCKAFRQKFFDSDNNTFGPAGANLFAYDMKPDENIVGALRQDLEKSRNHIFTGIFGTKLFFNVLADAGLSDQALEAFLQRDFPSFGHWIEQGATTTWEQWDGANSHCHPMFGGGLTWLYTWLGGIRFEGPRLIEICPHLSERITWVESSQENAYGKVHLRAERLSEARLKVSVDIPVGCQGVISNPSIPGKQKTVGSGHWELEI